MATHSSILAWRIPWTEESSRLQSMELQVGSLPLVPPGKYVYMCVCICVCVCVYIYIYIIKYNYIIVSEKAMAPHSSTLAWKNPWTEEPGRLPSIRSLGVRHDFTVTSLSLFTFMHWRRKWQPTPVFLPGESQGWRSLVGGTESDMTEAT